MRRRRRFPHQSKRQNYTCDQIEAESSENALNSVPSTIPTELCQFVLSHLYTNRHTIGGQHHHQSTTWKGPSSWPVSLNWAECVLSAIRLSLFVVCLLPRLLMFLLWRHHFITLRHIIDVFVCFGVNLFKMSIRSCRLLLNEIAIVREGTSQNSDKMSGDKQHICHCQQESVSAHKPSHTIKSKQMHSSRSALHQFSQQQSHHHLPSPSYGRPVQMSSPRLSSVLLSAIVVCFCVSHSMVTSSFAFSPTLSSTSSASQSNSTSPPDCATLVHNIHANLTRSASASATTTNVMSTKWSSLDSPTINDSHSSSSVVSLSTNFSTVKLKRSNDGNVPSRDDSGVVVEDVPPSAPLSANDDEEDEEEEDEEEDDNEDNSDNEFGGKNGRRKSDQSGRRRNNQNHNQPNSFESNGSTGPSASNDNVDYVMHSPRTVKTNYGVLQGIVITFVRYDKNASTPSSSVPPPPVTLSPVEAFLGVPYAKPPTGNRRFVLPVAPEHWHGVRQANHLPPVCPQPLPKLPPVTNVTTVTYESNGEPTLNRNMSQRYFERLTRQLPYLRNQSEDCLYLNIYVPFEQYYQQRHTFRTQQSSTTTKSSKRNKHRNNKFSDGDTVDSGGKSSRPSTEYPVIVFIHGDESYERDSGNSYDASILASYGRVVLVTLNYRLGVLGFLPPLVDGERGNYGLMDQVAALHWIKENIDKFGGNPDNVTVLGHGFGAACVHLLMLSPMAKGLFSRAALMSGSALAPSAIARDAEHYARLLAKELNCPVFDNVQLVECLKRKSVDELLSVDLAPYRFLSAFGPIVDGIVVPCEPRTIMEAMAYGSGVGGVAGCGHSKSGHSSALNYTFNGDILFGVTRVECPLGLFSAYDERSGIDLARRNKVLRTLVRNMYAFHQQTILWTLINEYTDWSRPSEHPINLLDSTMDILSDALVVAPLIETMELFAKAALSNPGLRVSSGYDFAYRDPNQDASSGLNRIFFYVFQNQNEESARLSINQRLGSMHSDELDYLFGAPISELVTGHSLGHFAPNLTRPIDLSLSEAVISHFTNFAKFGNPNLLSASSGGSSSSSSSPSLSSSESVSGGIAHHSTNYGSSASTSSGGSSPATLSPNGHSSELRSRFEQLNWPTYSIGQRRYLLIGSKPRVRDHYHSHRLSFWLNLIPRLMLDQYSRRYNDHLDTDDLLLDSFDKDDIGLRYIRHHLLDNYDVIDSYDGPVRQITLKNKTPSRVKFGVSSGTGSRIASASSGSSMLQMNSDQSQSGRTNESGSKTTSHTALQNDDTSSNEGVSGSNSHHKHHNGTGGAGGNGDHNESGNYSTALSVTIAVGCSLLVLNMLIFAGVYYQLDRHAKSRESSPINSSSQMYLNATSNMVNSKHYDSNNVSSKSGGSASTTITTLNNDGNEASTANYIHYNGAESQLVSIKSSQVHLDNGGIGVGPIGTSAMTLNPLGVDDYGMSVGGGAHVHHVHYLDQEPSSSSNTSGTLQRHNRTSTSTSGYHHHHHHHHLLDSNDADSATTAAILLANSQSSANTPTVSYYPLHSFANPSSSSSTNEVLDTSTLGRTSRIRFSLDSDTNSQYLDHQSSSGQLLTVSNVPSTNDAILSGQKSGTLKRVKI